MNRRIVIAGAIGATIGLVTVWMALPNEVTIRSMHRADTYTLRGVAARWTWLQVQNRDTVNRCWDAEYTAVVSGEVRTVRVSEAGCR